MSKNLTQKELADQLGISSAAVSQLKAKGMPVDSVERAQRWRNRHLQRGRLKGVRRVADAVAPMPATMPHDSEFACEAMDLDVDVDPVQEIERYKSARERREHYQAERERLAFQKEIGQVMLASEVIACVAEAGTAFRLALDQVPNKLAPLLVQAGDEHTIRQHLEREFESLLSNLAHTFNQLAKAATPNTLAISEGGGNAP